MRDIAAAVAACFSAPDAPALPLHLLPAGGFEAWLANQPQSTATWLRATNFKPKARSVGLLPDASGELAGAVAILSDPAELWDVAAASGALPGGTWHLVDAGGLIEPADAATAWALGAYRFDRYKTQERSSPVLRVDNKARARATILAEAVWQARDLVNTPTNDLGPAELQAAVFATGERFGATCRAIVGDELLDAGYPMIHAVGRASPNAPRLIELIHGPSDAPKLTLVGKGVCFDTGGLDIKPAAGMLLMRKDKGGAALMLALARAVMALGLTVRLRLLIPAVENSIAGNAFRPGDILRSRKGLTVEIGNTDAEGRLILADALTDADAEAPDLLLDAATLTGAARVAVGPELAALFTPDEALAADLATSGTTTHEPFWRLPLHKGYARYIESSSADLNNAGAKPFAGAITAALFLQRFVTTTKSWAHLDIFAWNDDPRPGRPKGGEATSFRALLGVIEGRFGGR